MRPPALRIITIKHPKIPHYPAITRPAIAPPPRTRNHRAHFRSNAVWRLNSSHEASLKNQFPLYLLGSVVTDDWRKNVKFASPWTKYGTYEFPINIIRSLSKRQPQAGSWWSAPFAQDGYSPHPLLTILIDIGNLPVHR